MKTAMVVGSSGNLGPIWCDILKKNGFDVYPGEYPDCDVQDLRSLMKHRIAVKKLDVVVYNAGVDIPPGGKAGFWDQAAHILNVNLIGAANTVRTFMPIMNGGNFTFIGSMLGFIASDYRNYPEGFDKNWAYGASKAGLWKLCKDLIVRHAKDGFVFNMLALSGVEGKQDEEFKKKYTAKIPIGRMLRREDFENEFLCCVKAKVPYDMPLFCGGGYSIW